MGMEITPGRRRRRRNRRRREDAEWARRKPRGELGTIETRPPAPGLTAARPPADLTPDQVRAQLAARARDWRPARG